MPSQVHYRKDDDRFVTGRIEHAIRKTANQHPTNVAFNARPGSRHGGGPLDGRVNLGCEISTQASDRRTSRWRRKTQSPLPGESENSPREALNYL
jgi:hypothetical protein